MNGFYSDQKMSSTDPIFQRSKKRDLSKINLHEPSIKIIATEFHESEFCKALVTKYETPNIMIPERKNYISISVFQSKKYTKMIV